MITLIYDNLLSHDECDYIINYYKHNEKQATKFRDVFPLPCDNEIDFLNYKLTKDIIVSNNQWFGHFSDIRSAVRYSKSFSELFPDMGSPTIHIRDGVYEVSDSILIDFVCLKINGSLCFNLFIWLKHHIRV